MYDPVGMERFLTYPNGTVKETVYDELNRILSVENRTSGGAMITSHAYTLGKAGHRLAVQEHDGRYVTWSYDDLYRLTDEDIVDPVNGDELISFSYDPVGNRLTRTDSSGGK